MFPFWIQPEKDFFFLFATMILKQNKIRTVDCQLLADMLYSVHYILLA